MKITKSGRVVMECQDIPTWDTTRCKDHSDPEYVGRWYEHTPDGLIWQTCPRAFIGLIDLYGDVSELHRDVEIKKGEY